MSQFVLESTPG